MVAARSTCLLLITTLGFTICAANICKSDDDCKIDGCECTELAGGVSYCTNAKGLSFSPKDCKLCKSDADCDSLGCTTSLGVCTSCGSNLVKTAFSRCSVEIQICKTDAQCTGSCSCSKSPADERIPFSVCVNQKAYESAAANCKSCTSDSDCPNSSCAAELGNRRVCMDCELPRNTDVFQCSGSSTTPDANTSTITPSATGTSIDASPESYSPSNETFEPTGTQGPAPCVSTDWLRREGLIDATIRQAGPADVLCIPGLPCGTHGHMVRDYKSNLITYRDACRLRTDCVESRMEVSQLSHSFDWSRVRSVDGKLSLTSLSVHPDSKTWATDRLIATLADHLNRSGFGFVCNALVLLPSKIRNGVLVHFVTSS